MAPGNSSLMMFQQQLLRYEIHYSNFTTNIDNSIIPSVRYPATQYIYSFESLIRWNIFSSIIMLILYLFFLEPMDYLESDEDGDIQQVDVETGRAILDAEDTDMTEDCPQPQLAAPRHWATRRRVIERVFQSQWQSPSSKEWPAQTAV
jgi:hypothetical protein